MWLSVVAVDCLSVVIVVLVLVVVVVAVAVAVVVVVVVVVVGGGVLLSGCCRIVVGLCLTRCRVVAGFLSGR